MQVKIRCRPAYSLGYVTLDLGEELFVERRAMAVMSGGLSVRATTGGGVGRALVRKVAGGETIVYTCFRAELADAWVAVSPAFPGDVEVVDLYTHAPMLVQSGSVLAYGAGVQTSVRYGGVRGVVLQEGVTFIRLAGEGLALVSSYGAIETFTLGDGEQLVVDTGHLVGFTESMGFEVGPLGSLQTAALSGEGLVARFTGPGEVLIQSRAEQELRSWLLPDRQHNQR
jgi:uncharacterized protein (TIGR00266 family)